MVGNTVVDQRTQSTYPARADVANLTKHAVEQVASHRSKCLMAVSRTRMAAVERYEVSN